MTIEVLPAASEQQPILARLLQLYIHDFTEFHDLDLQADGTFAYSDLPLYWLDPGHHPFLILLDEKLAGFVLVKRGSEISSSADVWDMAEFFILRRYRRRGCGAEAARQIWAQLPGPWEVRVMDSNPAALHFWQHAISAFVNEPATSERVPRRGAVCHLFSFAAQKTR